MSVWSNLKALLYDLKGAVVPNQYYNPTTDQMEVVQGSGGAANVSLAGRNVIYKRVLANQTVSASGVKSTVVSLSSGIKGVQAVFTSTGAGWIQLYPCDANGSPISQGTNFAQTNTAGRTSGGCLITEYGGNQYINVIFTDTSAAQNTLNFVDLWATLA